MLENGVCMYKKFLNIPLFFLVLLTTRSFLYFKKQTKYIKLNTNQTLHTVLTQTVCYKPNSGFQRNKIQNMTYLQTQLRRNFKEEYIHNKPALTDFWQKKPP